MNRPICAALLLATALPSLAACGAEPAAQTVAETGIPGLAASNARLVLPAVSGNPAGVYFDLANTGERGVAVRKATVAGAGSAQIHGTMEFSGEMTMGETGPQSVLPGQTIKFEPGALHVMAFDLDPATKAGDSVTITLTAAGGKTMEFDAEVRAAGDER